MAFAEGEYRWVAEMVNHVVFANPANAEARNLQARRAGAARLPGRVGHLAQRLPDGRAGTAQRGEDLGRQFERARRGARHDQRAAVRLHRAAPEPREQGKKIPQLVQAGLVRVEGDPKGFGAVVANIMNFEPVFNIGTP